MVSWYEIINDDKMEQWNTEGSHLSESQKSHPLVVSDVSANICSAAS